MSLNELTLIRRNEKWVQCCVVEITTILLPEPSEHTVTVYSEHALSLSLVER